MSLWRAVKLWFLYYIWWGVLLSSFSGYIGLGAELSNSYSLYTMAMAIAIFHTAFKLKYGGFRGLYRSRGGLKGYFSRVKEERMRKETEMANMKSAREAATRRYRIELENNVLNYMNDVTDLRVVSNKFNITSADVLGILKESIKQGRIQGNFQNIDSTFISDNFIKKLIREKLL